MISRGCRRCCYMNNSQCPNSNQLETKCNNICPCPSMDYDDNCSCGFDEDMNVFPTDPMLAQSYVPIQYMEDTFLPTVGLKKGTLFPELVSEYRPGDSMKDIEYLRKTNKIGEGCNSCYKKM